MIKKSLYYITMYLKIISLRNSKDQIIHLQKIQKDPFKLPIIQKLFFSDFFGIFIFHFYAYQCLKEANY